MNLSKTIRYILGILSLAVVYHLIARLGLQMAYVQANTSPVWPPSGIALAALLIMGIRYWPGITLGVVVGSLLTGAPLPVALGLGIANTLEALIGTYLLKRWIGFHLSFDRIRDVVGLAAAAAVSTAVSATLGVATLFGVVGEIQTPFFTLWGTWWVGNLLGVLVITPFILVWVKNLPKRLHLNLILESAVYIILLILVTGYVFDNPSGTGILHQALIYVIFPFAIWAALRLEQRGAVTTIFIVSGISIWGTVHGLGPFSQLPINESLILLQTFTGVVSLTTLTLAASASERRHAEQALNRRVEDLAALNDASKEFLGKLDKTRLYEAICRLVVDRLGLFGAWIELAGPEKAAEEDGAQVAAFYDAPQAANAIVKETRLNPAIRNHILDAEQRGETFILQQIVPSLDSARPVEPAENALSFAALPLGYAGKVTGVLCVISQGENNFPKEQVLLLELYANLAAVAIQNAWLFDQVRLGNEQLHALSHRLMEIQEQERIHLSRELHDESGQILAALMVRLGLLERDAAAPDQMKAHIAELNESLPKY